MQGRRAQVIERQRMPFDLVSFLQVRSSGLLLQVDDVRVLRFREAQDDEVRRSILAVPAEVAPARHWLCRLLAGDHAAIVDDVVLMACEALTNSICHSDSGGRDGSRRSRLDRARRPGRGGRAARGGRRCRFGRQRSVRE